MDVRPHVPAGRLNGISAEVGTIIGPTWTREYLVVTESYDDHVLVGYARAEEVDETAIMVMQLRGPRSIAEYKMTRGEE